MIVLKLINMLKQIEYVCENEEWIETKHLEELVENLFKLIMVERKIRDRNHLQFMIVAIIVVIIQMVLVISIFGGTQ